MQNPRARSSLRVMAIPSILMPLVLLTLPPGTAQAPDVTFEVRVRAQLAIERLYYSHQIGTTRSFEEAVPRAVVEQKVRTYLKESVALEKFWNTPVTAELLRAEVERMKRGSRTPERLREIFGALGDDPVLVQECLARPVLVDRLVHNFFAYDQRIHAEARGRAEALHRGLLSGRINPLAPHPNRTVVQLGVANRETRGGQEQGRGDAVPKRGVGGLQVGVPPQLFQKWLDRLPPGIGDVGAVVEDREGFVTRIVLKKGEGAVQFASFEVTKRSWEDWWREVEVSLDERMRPPEGDGPVGVTASPQAAAPPCDTDDTWDNGSLDDFPVPRRNHAAVWTGSHMLIWGGSFIPTHFADETYLNTGSRYDPATDTWTQMSTRNAPQARAGHTAVWTGSQMIVWGGLVSPSGTGFFYLNTGARYDPLTDAWAPVSTSNAPQGRWRQAAVWTGSVMLVWGGASPTAYLITGGRYDPVTDTWSATSLVNTPSARARQSAVWTGRHLVVWGGDTGSTWLNTGGRYDPATDTWSATSLVNAPAARAQHSAVWTGSQMLVWGGADRSDGAKYDPTADTWAPISNAGAPAPRNGHSAVWTGSQMVVWGGWKCDPLTDACENLTTGGLYDAATDTWTSTSTVNAPSGREGQTAVWTGDRMVVWGGVVIGFIVGVNFHPETGGRYDPVSDTWTPTSTDDAPPIREQHTAVWTGNVMVVWGGLNSNDWTSPNRVRLHDTGGRYDPATDNWTATSTTNAPVGRVAHTAVWTGNVMVVWGGESWDLVLGRNVLDRTGGRYDPVTDTWTPTSLTDAPSARSGHTAVWTGSQIIVWGGALDPGGRYDPATDTWTGTTSTVNAPEGRAAHTAIWTGTHMLVWGGCGQVACLNTGGQYDPSNDTWTETSTTNAPEPRWWYTAVWTGREMVVWGGAGGQGVLSTGGRYDPVSDAWTATSTLNAAEPRVSHTAVWTGREMVVWGGQGQVLLFLSTGGRYDPATDTWRSTTSTESPSARLAHTAVWADGLMLVWGGDEGTDSKSGGRYCACTPIIFYQDADGDGYGNREVWVESCTQPPAYVTNNSDCDGSAAGVWTVPGEVRNLLFLDDRTLVWTAPADGGATAVVYDVIRAASPSNFVTGADCVVSDGAAATAADPSSPPVGGAFFYLARAQNGCPNGQGSLGTSSDGAPRAGRSCP